MKRISSLLLSFYVLLLSLAACSDKDEIPVQDTKTTELSVGQTYTVANYADFTFLKISTTDKITAAMDDRNYYPVEDKSTTYIDIVLSWNNISDHSMKVQDLITAKATNASGTSYTNSFNVIEIQNATDLSQEATIPSSGTDARVHCAIAVPRTETVLTLALRIHDQEFTFSYTLGAVASNATPIKIGHSINDPAYASLSFQGVEHTDTVYPSDTEGLYSCYHIDDPANTYLVVRFDVTNHTDAAKDCDSFINVTARYADQNHTGFVVVENASKNGFNTKEDITPSILYHFYYLIEVPKDVTEKPLTLTIFYNGKEYLYNT